MSAGDDRPPRAPSPETLAAQALGRVDPRTGALGPGIHPSTTFERDPDGGYSTGRGYIRPHNPTHDEPAELLAALEGGSECLLFASGMAAATAVFQSLLPGDHVVVSRVMYWALRKWLIDFAMPWGLQVEFVNAPDPAAVAAAVRPGRTRLVWIETPANPTWEITDIAATAAIAREARARLVVDATVATPVLTRPLEHGADLVVHSATKYLNGHSDVLAGALVCREQDAFWQRVRAWHRDAGGVLGTFEAWLLQRGMRTLFVRVQRASASAAALAERLQAHPSVAQVLYPGLPSHPGHAVARRQMRGGFGGMLSIRVRGGRAAAMAVAARVTVFKRATSLGGVESLIEHRASIEGPASPVPDDLLRLSVGLEAVEDLASDLEQALAHAGGAVAAPAGSGEMPAAVAAAGATPAHAPGGVRGQGASATPGRAPEGAGGQGVSGVTGEALDGSDGHGLSALPEPSPGAETATRRTPPPAGEGPRVAAERVVREQVAPVVAERGGAVRVADLRDGMLWLALEGSPAALVPILDSVRELLHHHVPEVRDVAVAPQASGGAAAVAPERAAGEDVAREPGGEVSPGAGSASGAPAPSRAASPGGREPRDLAARVEALLAERINPAVAAHGGRIVLEAVAEGSVLLRMEGGCQGCAMAEVTLRQGVEPLLREVLPDAVAVVDVTDHPAGAAPFFRTRKGPA